MRIITVRVPGHGRAGTRIKATSEGRTFTMAYPVGLPSEDAHRVAARELFITLGGTGPLRRTHQSRRGYTWHSEK
jgi:hypothetical protein